MISRRGAAGRAAVFAACAVRLFEPGRSGRVGLGGRDGAVLQARIVRARQVHVGDGVVRSLGARAAALPVEQVARLLQPAEVLVDLVGEGGGLPAERLVGVELLVAGSRGDDAVVFEDGYEVREVALRRVIDPAFVRVGDQYDLAVLCSFRKAFFRANFDLPKEVVVLLRQLAPVVSL